MAARFRGFDAAKQRRGFVVALAVLATLLVPAAIAWACNPQAYITLDRET